jgi:arsenate reductase (glutaredoxin)
MKIYHNPRCSKSRETLALIEENGNSIEVIHYLEETPTVQELTEIITLLGISPEELIRKNEDIYKTTFKNQSLTNAEWIQAMVDNPKLIERPIVIHNNKAIIGRPPQKVLELL